MPRQLSVDFTVMEAQIGFEPWPIHGGINRNFARSLWIKRARGARQGPMQYNITALPISSQRNTGCEA